MHVSVIYFIAVIQGILMFAHYAVYRTFIFFADVPNIYFPPTRWIFFFLSIFFTLSSLIISFGYSTLGRIFYTLSAVWLGVLFWLFVFSVLGALVWVLLGYLAPALTANGAVIHILNHAFVFKHLYGFLILAIVLAINFYGLINAFDIKTKEYDISLPNLPKVWEGKKIVMIADTHFGNVWNVWASKRTAKMIEDIHPEAILIAGDFFDGPTINYYEAAAPIGAIETKYGTFYATGNHEEYKDKNIYINPLHKNHITVLQNEIRNLDGLIIAGINYGDSKTAESQEYRLRKMLGITAFDKIEADHIIHLPTILIKHVPDLLDVAAEAGVNLQVSGHTHKGQMWPMTLIAKRVYGKFYYGLNTFTSSDASSTSDLQVLTTSGAGSWGPPQRIGTNSEITVITLHKK